MPTTTSGEQNITAVSMHVVEMPYGGTEAACVLCYPPEPLPCCAVLPAGKALAYTLLLTGALVNSLA